MFGGRVRKNKQHGNETDGDESSHGKFIGDNRGDAGLFWKPALYKSGKYIFIDFIPCCLRHKPCKFPS